MRLSRLKMIIAMVMLRIFMRNGISSPKITVSLILGCNHIISIARRVAEDRTVIVSTVRPYLKGFAYIDSVPEKTIFSTGFALLNSKNEENYISKLLYYLFMFSDNLMKQMETALPKAAYPSINKEDIDNFKIPLLTMDEQKRIVAQIEALELEITKARTLMESAASEKQAILDKYL